MLHAVRRHFVTGFPDLLDILANVRQLSIIGISRGSGKLNRLRLNHLGCSAACLAKQGYAAATQRPVGIFYLKQQLTISPNIFESAYPAK